MADDPPETPEDFAGRLRLAMRLEKKTPTRTEREAGIKRGYMTRLKSGEVQAPTPETIRQLADYLNVAYEWLAIGRGPMHPEGWAPSPLEEAMLFAKRQGARDDAIAAAAARFRNADDMTAWDWLREFDAEARRLERAGTPRPELLAKNEAAFRRTRAKGARQAEARRAAEAKAASKRASHRPQRGGGAA